MTPRGSIGRLHVLTDGTLQARFDHVTIARFAARGGADVVQFRDKRPLPPARREAIARAMQRALAALGVELVIDDHVEVARVVGARGVHLGRDDAPPVEARRRLGSRALIGRTANSLEEALAVVGEPIDYLGVGPVYGTHSKTDPAPALGPAGLRAIVRAVGRPVIAIGSITPDRVAEVLECGAHGVAVLSAVVLAEDPCAATERFRRALDAARAATADVGPEAR